MWPTPSPTTTAPVVTEALHETGGESVRALLSVLVPALTAAWRTDPSHQVLTPDAPTTTHPAQ